MNWLYELGLLEICFIVAFIVLYGLYIFRVEYISRTLQTSFNGVLIKIAIRTIYFALILIAILGPSFGESKREVQSIGKDIFVLVDLSQSMNATDVQPSRLEKVKFELKNIVDEFNSDRIGIIIFSSESFVQAPLTFDQNALNLFIETLNTSLVPNAGTDFAPPIKMALKKLTEEDSPVTQQKSKIIILISDGEDFGEETSAIAQQVEDEGIKLFTLGVGTSRGSKILTSKGYKRDKSGNEVVTKLDSKVLRSLATETGGKYFEINATNNDVSRLINTIKRIQGEIRDTRQVDVSANRYYYFLGAALLLIIFDLLTSFRTIKI